MLEPWNLAGYIFQPVVMDLDIEITEVWLRENA